MQYENEWPLFDPLRLRGLCAMKHVWGKNGV
jgi:hypothetical protein